MTEPVQSILPSTLKIPGWFEFSTGETWLIALVAVLLAGVVMALAYWRYRIARRGD